MNIAFEMPLPLGGLCILTIDLLTEQVKRSGRENYLKFVILASGLPRGACWQLPHPPTHRPPTLY